MMPQLTHYLQVLWQTVSMRYHVSNYVFQAIDRGEKKMDLQIFRNEWCNLRLGQTITYVTTARARKDGKHVTVELDAKVIELKLYDSAEDALRSEGFRLIMPWKRNIEDAVGECNFAGKADVITIRIAPISKIRETRPSIWGRILTWILLTCVAVWTAFNYPKLVVAGAILAAAPLYPKRIREIMFMWRKTISTTIIVGAACSWLGII